MTKGYLSEIFVSFQGEGAHVGRRHVFIRMAGCNLRCNYCDTPYSLERVPTFQVHTAQDGSQIVANPISPADVAAHVLSALGPEGTVDGCALTGGEPLLQADFLAELLAANTLPRPRLLETSGMLPNQLRLVLPWIDIVSMDIKLPSNTGEAEFWEEHRRFLALARGRVYVKLLVNTGTADDDVARAAELVCNAAKGMPLFLQPITKGSGEADIDQEALRRFYLIARRFLTDVRVVPQMHKLLGIR